MCASVFAAVADRVSRARDHCVAAVHTDRRPLLVGQQGPHRSFLDLLLFLFSAATHNILHVL
jgi:hypothetical protein